jgi:hypothetical protein
MHNRPCGRRMKERTPIDEPIVRKYQANEIHDSRPLKVLLESHSDCLLFCVQAHKPHGNPAGLGSEMSGAV